MNKKFVYGAIMLTFIVAVLALLVGLGSGSSEYESTGGMTNLDGLTITPVDSGDGFKVGPSSTATRHDAIFSGTTNCVGPDVTMIMGSTSTTTCSVSGVSSGDTVVIVPPAGHVPGLRYEGVATTSNVIGVVLYNATTSSLTIGANSTSSVGYVIFSR